MAWNDDASKENEGVLPPLLLLPSITHERHIPREWGTTVCCPNSQSSLNLFEAGRITIDVKRWKCHRQD